MYTDSSAPLHSFIFSQDLDIVPIIGSLVHHDFEMAEPFYIPVHSVLQNLKQAFKCQYKDLKELVLSDTNFVNKYITKVNKGGSKTIMKRILSNDTKLVNEDITIVTKRDNKTLKKRVLPEDTNFDREDITKETNSNNKLLKKRVLPDNTNFVNEGVTMVTNNDNKILTAHKRVDKKIKSVPGMFPEDACIIRRFPEDPLKSLPALTPLPPDLSPQRSLH